MRACEQAAALAARGLEEQMCTFSPELTARAREARSRSARELSIGDSVARAAKQVCVGPVLIFSTVLRGFRLADD